MSESDLPRRVTRRTALKGTTAAAAAALASTLVASGSQADTRYAFHGTHQAGVTTPIQDHLAFATFDVTDATRAQLVALLRTWSDAAARYVEGAELASAADPYLPPTDTGETIGLSAAGLSLTFGFGPSLFDDRFGLARRRPTALIDLPPFPGDDLDPLRSGGDLCVQACANDPVVAFHAVRNLARLGLGTVALRYLQLGSGRTSTSSASETTPRNLLGFKDGTNNLKADSSSAMDEHVWVDDASDQPWMVGGTYLVARRVRTHLEDWSSQALTTQEMTIGRFRDSGAPLTGRREHDPLRLNAVDHFGLPVIPATAHVRVAAPVNNDGARILRRGFNFTDGVDPVTGELDAGLMFLCFQKDPARQFVTLQNNLALQDALSNYVTHTGSGIFACPPGAPRGTWIGSQLF